MSCQGLRYLHIADASLDCPVSGTGPFPEAPGSVLENAPLTAFQRAVAAAVDREVDFVLLTGTTFDESAGSLTARLALLNGLRHLAEQEIPVVVAPGNGAPREAWQDIPGLPDTVHLICPETRPAVTVNRHGECLAGVQWVDGEAAAPPDGQPVPPKPFRIGVSRAEDGAEPAPADGETAVVPYEGEAGVHYLVPGGTADRRTVRGPYGLVHHPGGLQGLGPRQTGPHGATLVEVDPDGHIECTLLPTAPVRWERFRVDVDERTGRDGLIEQMRAALRNRAPQQGEQVWLIRWDVHGAGPLWEHCADAAFQRQVTEPLGREFSADDSPDLVHRFVLHPDLQQVQPDPAGEPLAAEYFEELAGLQPLPEPASMLPASSVSEGKADRTVRLERLASELDHDAIFSRAARLGLRWFGTPANEDPAHEDS